MVNSLIQTFAMEDTNISDIIDILPLITDGITSRIEKEVSSVFKKFDNDSNVICLNFVQEGRYDIFSISAKIL